MSYQDFLAAKRATVPPAGVIVDRGDLHSMLHDWQAEIVQWAAEVGRPAIWADTGLGKTFMQVEWARVSAETALIVAPLAVTQQTIREAAKVGTSGQLRAARGMRSPGRGCGSRTTRWSERFDPGAIRRRRARRGVHPQAVRRQDPDQADQPLRRCPRPAVLHRHPRPQRP